MYFDFEDYRPDVPRVPSAISWREGVLLSIIAHLVMIIIVILSPKWFSLEPRVQTVVARNPNAADQPRFVFVQPRLDLKAPKAPERAEPSDQDRVARAPQKAPNPTNPLPFSRGNTPERVQEDASRARGQGPAPDPAAGQQAQNAPPSPPAPQQTIPDSPSGFQMPSPRTQPTSSGVPGRSSAPGGSLGDALKNLQRYVQTFDNSQGGGGEFGPEIQFDTKGVEFGPWIRRFIAQVKRNWNVPYAAMSLKGHVVVTFNVHKDGSITDVTIAGPCPVEAFNNAAFGALVASNPTQPLPPEYPTEKAFFTVTFFYNETPP